MSLADHQRFENLLSSLSDAFRQLDVAEFDRAVQSGLRQIVAVLEVARASLIEFPSTRSTVPSLLPQEPITSMCSRMSVVFAIHSPPRDAAERSAVEEGAICVPARRHREPCSTRLNLGPLSVR